MRRTETVQWRAGFKTRETVRCRQIIMLRCTEEVDVVSREIARSNVRNDTVACR